MPVHFRMAKCPAKVILGICGRAVIFLQCQISTARPVVFPTSASAVLKAAYCTLQCILPTDSFRLDIGKLSLFRCTLRLRC